MTFRVLLTSVGGAMSPYTIRCLLDSPRHEVEVIGVDADPGALGRHFVTVFETVPNGDAPDYAERIRIIADRHGADLILPCSDEEAFALARSREQIETKGRQLACPPFDAVEVMMDKLSTLQLLEKHSIPAPEWRVASDFATIEKALLELSSKYKSVVVKPIRSRGSRDVHVVERDRKGIYRPAGHREQYLDLDTFRRQVLPGLASTLPLLVMEGLSAPAHDTDVLCMNGRILRSVPRQRVNPAGIPFKGGIVLDDPALHSIAARAAAALEASWLFDIDTMTSEAGVCKVIEMNCRPSGSLSAAVAAGVPILDDLISVAKGETLRQPSPLPHGVTVLPFISIEVLK